MECDNSHTLHTLHSATAVPGSLTRAAAQGVPDKKVGNGAASSLGPNQELYVPLVAVEYRTKHCCAPI